MTTLSEFLKTEENQGIVLGKIIESLRELGRWGRRGVFAGIAFDTGFSPAYVGQVLTGKKPLTDVFVMKISDYLGKNIGELTGESEVIHVRFNHDEMITTMRRVAAQISTPAETIKQIGIAVVLLLQEGASDKQIITEIRGLEKQYFKNDKSS